MKKLNLLFTVVVFLLGNGLYFSQAVDRLYLTLANTGRVYDITALSATPATAIALPTPLATPNLSATPANASNLAVGYDVPGGNPSNLVFISSNITANSALYKNGTAIANTLPNVQIGGIATNNVPGTYLGNVYGFQSNTKSLYPIYPSGAAVPITSSDADWTNGTTFGTDTFFDYQNNIYMFVNNAAATARYLFKIDIATGVATKAITNAISGPAATVGSIQGMAYLQGYVYIATVTASTVEVRRINIYDGTSILSATYTGGNNGNLDLATVPYYVPFTLTCGGITQSSTTTPFIERVPSNGVRSLNIPITNVYGPGTYTINIIGANFNSSSTVNITASTTSITVPLVYDGGGSSGTRTLSVNLNGSTTACSVNVVVEKDTDSDGIPDITDLDDDNDGILDTAECGFICGNPFENGGFEFPVITGSTNVNQNTPGVGWETTATDGQIELWRTGFNGVPAAEGSQFAELNATQASTLYQTFCLNGMGGTLTWSVKHRGRSGTDVAAVKFGTTIANAQAAAATQTMSDGNTAWGSYSGVFNIPQGSTSYVIAFQAISTATGDPTVGNFIDDVQVVMSEPCIDTDGDGIIDSLDVDSDNDGCPDAIEGSEAVRYDQVYRLNLPTNDANYAYRGQIKTIYDGVTAGTPAGIVSNSAAALGVPQLVNNAGNNLNTTTNPSNLAGIADNTDGTSDIGQGIGTSKNSGATDAECTRCFRPATTAGTTLVTNHGITALARAGGATTDWPGKIKGAYTALDAKTKGFVINRVPTTALASITGVIGMIVYDTTVNCLKMYDGTGWNCYSKQTCDDFNQ